MIRKADPKEAAVLAGLALQLWPGHRLEDLAGEFAEYLQDPQCALFLAFHGAAAVGFAQCQLRHDYVEGTDSSPVGYLEGVFVAQSCRGRGYARQLVCACEDWAREQGCTEFASDCALTNTASLAFHLSCGFSEANRIICFTKKL